MGSRSTTKTEIPAYIEEAGKLALQRAQEIQGMGDVPYMGPEVAAVNPFEQAAAANVGSMASAFGLQASAGIDMGGMPTVTQGGMTGYSSYPAYAAALERLKEQRPDQYNYMAGMTRFDPITGMENPEYVARMEAARQAQAARAMPSGGNDDGPMFAPVSGGSSSPSYNVSTTFGSGSTPRPVLRGESTGGSGLFSDLRDARDEITNQIYTALGGRG
jgi:hypothetical protein